MSNMIAATAPGTQVEAHKPKADNIGIGTNGNAIGSLKHHTRR